MAVREWIQEQPTDQITAYGLAKAVGDYLDSKKAASTVEKFSSFDQEETASGQGQRDAGSTSWGWSMGYTERESILMAMREMWFFIAMGYSFHAGSCCSDGSSTRSSIVS